MAGASEALRRVAETLDRTTIPWCVFGGAAVQVHDPGRGFEDIDLLVRTDGGGPLRALFPLAAAVGPNGLRAGAIEWWWPPLVLRTRLGILQLRFDEEMVRRRWRGNLLGSEVWFLSLEDLLVMKALLQRGPVQGKRDREDIRVLLRQDRRPIDPDYLTWRAEACGSGARVLDGLASALGGVP